MITTKTIYVCGNGMQFDTRERAENYEAAHAAAMAIDDGRFNGTNQVQEFVDALLALQERGWKLAQPPRCIDPPPGQMSR